jgi:glycosyltransferase involved in cell wall biosynthesis
LDRALVSLADAALRRRLGDAARARVVREFSWTAHCAVLEERLRQLVNP